MIDLKFARTFLLILLVLYYSQGVFYAQGSMLSQLSLLLIVLVSFSFFVKSFLIKSNINLFYFFWTALLILNVFGYIFSGAMYNALFFGMLKAILINSLIFYGFYYFSYKGVLKARHLRIFFMCMLPIAILQFYLNENQILSERISNKVDVVNNVSYAFVGLIPYVFLFKGNKRLGGAFLLIIMFFIIQGAKRGALIAAVIGVISYIYFHIKTIDRKYGVVGYLLILLGFLIFGFFVYRFFSANEYFILRIENMIIEGGSSGRDRIYDTIFTSWYSAPHLLNLFFGFGFGASTKFTGGSFAHNDWLELLSNFGILGVLVYVGLFYASVKLCLNTRWSIDKRILLSAIVVIWFFITLVSISYASLNSYSQAILLGYLIGGKENDFV